MRGSNFKVKGTSFKLIHKGDHTLDCWKFNLTDGLVAVTAPNKSLLVDDYYIATITLEDADYWLLTKWGINTEIVMVGSAEVVNWLYAGETGKTYNYRQIALSDGSDLKNENMVEAGSGFYYAQPTLNASMLIFDNTLITTLTIPYIVINCTEGGDGIATDKNFVNVKYSTFGFLGERNSYFDSDQGKWINNDNVEAKASDLAKAVCYKYNLVWDDQNDNKWIGKYIKYIRTYEENAGKFRLYIPYKTPESNSANFKLVQSDEDNNYYVRGVSILLLQKLETVNGTDGAIIPFRH